MIDKYEVITYEDVIVFNYALPGQDSAEEISREVILVWKDTLEKIFEVHTPDKPYKITLFEKERDKERFIANIGDKTEKIIDAMDEEISQKMKFGHFFTSPTYED